jgi:hypothetical protein
VWWKPKPEKRTATGGEGKMKGTVNKNVFEIHDKPCIWCKVFNMPCDTMLRICEKKQLSCEHKENIRSYTEFYRPKEVKA